MTTSRALAFALLAFAGCYYELANSIEGPSEPGVIALSPPAVVATPGTSRRVTATLFASDGTTVVEQPVFRFTAEDEDVATAASDGTIAAVALGTTMIEVTDGSHGVTLLEVMVPETLPSGPVALACAPKTIIVPAGGRVMPAITVLDANGNALPASSVTFQTDATIATFDGSALEGVAPGVTSLRAIDANGAPLLGACTIVVGGSSSGTTCLPGPSEWCYLARYPRWMSRPGLSSPVRVTQLSTVFTDDCSTTQTLESQVTPDRVDFETPGVATMFGGKIVGSAPGSTRYTVSRRGEDCGDAALSVSIDLGGEWAVTCGNEDEGKVVLPKTPAKIATTNYSGYGAGARTEVLRAESRGTSAYCGSSPSTGPFSCGGDATSVVNTVHPVGGQFGLCSKTTCNGASIGDCASSRHPGPATFRTSDELYQGDCTYRRGSQSLKCPVSACSPRGLACVGVSITFCIEDNTCHYEVNGMRFPCPGCQDLTGCASAATDYAYQRCNP